MKSQDENKSPIIGEVEATTSSQHCGNALLDAVLILEGNKLIAKFMDVPFDERDFTDDRSIGGNADAVRYHRDWNWLMAVVEKIAKDNTAIGEVIAKRFTLKHIMFHEIIGSIETLWVAVVEFIKCYNTHVQKV